VLFQSDVPSATEEFCVVVLSIYEGDVLKMEDPLLPTPFSVEHLW
jgi:hypothetical protein